MLLSIIIPVYNLENYIGRCLDSCLAQTVQGGYEIICVNDGSTDNSLAVLREYEDKYPNIRVIDKSNGGVSSARNAGIEAATGEYLWFVDGDDWVAEGCLSVIENALLKHDNKVDSILFGFLITNEYAQKDISKDIVEVELLGQYATLKKSYSNSVWCRWLNADVIKRHNLRFDTRMMYGEDTLFLAKYNIWSLSAIAIEVPIYYYFQREQSAMNRLDAQNHSSCMVKLATEYKRIADTVSNAEIIDKMNNAVLRAMQAACRDLCLYCNDRVFAKRFLSLLKKNGLYPYGIDWKQFKRDRKQSFKNDLMNWLFGFLSWKPYFWLCWGFCGVVFKSKRTHKFSISIFEDILEINGE